MKRPRSSLSVVAAALGALALLLAGPASGGGALPANADPAPPVPVSGSSLLQQRHPQLSQLAGPRAVRPSDAPRTPSQSFWAYDYHAGVYYRVRAQMRHAGPTVLIYVEEGHSVPGTVVRHLAEVFEELVYPRLRLLYGHDPQPGIDGDPAITLLLLDIRDPYGYQVEPYTYISGYFDPANQMSQAELDLERPGLKSNEREMIYVDIAPTEPRGLIARQTLAHEFAHLIQWNYDPDEDGWLTEGLSELAVHVSELDHPREHVEAFLTNPEATLTEWAGTPADYGKVYLFTLYLWEQVGRDDPLWLRRLVADPADGLDAVRNALPDDRPLERFFRDYGLALHLDDRSDDPRHGFDALDMRALPTGDQFARPAAHRHTRYPVQDEPVRLTPWSLRADRFLEGEGALALNLQPTRPACVGLALHGARTAVETDCPAPGQPASWVVSSFGPRRTVHEALTVVANASDEMVDLELVAGIPQRPQGLTYKLFIPRTERN